MTDERALGEAMIRSAANDDLTFKFNVVYRDMLERMKKLEAENDALRNRIKDMEQRTSTEDRIARVEQQLRIFDIHETNIKEEIRALKTQMQALQSMSLIPSHPGPTINPIITYDNSSGHFNGEYHGEDPITDDYSGGGF